MHYLVLYKRKSVLLSQDAVCRSNWKHIAVIKANETHRRAGKDAWQRFINRGTHIRSLGSSAKLIHFRRLRLLRLSSHRRSSA